MKVVNVVLVGLGNLGKAFVQLIQEKKNLCHNRYYGQNNSHGWKIRPEGNCSRSLERYHQYLQGMLLIMNSSVSINYGYGSVSGPFFAPAKVPSSR